MNENLLKEISEIFCGNYGEYFNYKTGPELIKFFNQYYNKNDVYNKDFPTRWVYVYNNLIELVNKNKINHFFTLILSKEYIINERKSNEVEAVKYSNEIFEAFLNVLRPYGYSLVKNNKQVKIVEINDDLEYLDGGGYANVYYQKSSGRIVKKLKEDFLLDSDIKSRFRREYSITKSLSDIPEIIKVYEFDNNNYSYQMEEAEITLEKYVNNNNLDFDKKVNIIRQVLQVMSRVHERNVIHRDISPNNIFILRGMIKIADFGLGKDLKLFNSHQTMATNGVGQLYYCAPEQFMLLREGDMRSDIYSLGRLINFVLTGSPRKQNHQFRSIVDKACSENSEYRYANAGELTLHFERRIQIYNDKSNEERILKNIRAGKLDLEVIDYINDLTGKEICGLIINEPKQFLNVIINYMKVSDKNAQDMMHNIYTNYTDVAGKSFEPYDNFAKLSAYILLSKFNYTVFELAANILNFVAYSVNRYSAQDLIEEVMNKGIDPLIEDILTQRM
ncbi:serine/threonine protein kinase [Mammaliicoccus sciuri]|uniref:serine/threonine-protein kinase n=1 Tax=Mammaliicoccus sciuri TaxID=1296 RepID=UPI00132F9B82|nr:serine/threonine-protein kinase [Mammaliicoccus sciuri]MCP1287695.1 serine/threonine protein kinase [Mammaliicoccus sciuri]